MKRERIPLTIYVPDRKSAFSLIFLVSGYTTRRLANLKVGDYILDIAGPLGRPSEILQNKNLIF
jgi:ferredoxin--NADP+ reductase